MTAVLQTDRLAWMMLCTCAALWEETPSGFPGLVVRQTGHVSYAVRERDSDTVHRCQGDQLRAWVPAEPDTVLTETQVAQFFFHNLFIEFSNRHQEQVIKEGHRRGGISHDLGPLKLSMNLRKEDHISLKSSIFPFAM